METKKYLWINITDMDEIGKIPVLGSPFLMFINKDLGDNLLDGSWYNKERLDEAFIIIETSQERAEAIGRDLLAGCQTTITKFFRHGKHLPTTRVLSKP